ncbi:septum formation initiator family protein [Rothia kristinae]|uniref:Septum formation initiator family protein n=1 Tax=Rothia kristinae TaxID=37923 RepID=A0A7T4MUW6_9MICC|nr:septum formation initiator family protein [Rothia kristinae]QQC60067.1 septum formation initiator family protein [Rothia kristinae]
MRNPLRGAARWLGYTRPPARSAAASRPTASGSTASGSTDSRATRPADPEQPSEVELVEQEDPRGALVGAEDWSEQEDRHPTLEPVAARSFSGRTLLLLLIAAVLVVPLAPTVHRYFAQQAEIQSLHRDIADLQSQQADLEEQKKRWDSDDYVRQQARERLMYVDPGATPYMVIGQQEGPAQADDSSAEAAAQGHPSWGTSLWESVAGTR